MKVREQVSEKVGTDRIQCDRGGLRARRTTMRCRVGATRMRRVGVSYVRSDREAAMLVAFEVIVGNGAERVRYNCRGLLMRRTRAGPRVCLAPTAKGAWRVGAD